MKRNVPAWSGFAMALLVPMWLLSVPAAAQSHGSSGGSSSSGGGATSSSGGGGGSSSTGTSHAGSGGGSSSGTAVSRDSGGSSGSTSSGGGVSSGGAVGSTRGGSDTLIAGGSSGGGTRAHAGYRGDGTTRNAGDPVPPYARPRGDRPASGEYTPRTGPQPVPGGRATGGIYLPTGYYGGYYPYGYGGLGFGSYYGYNDPWYDPFYGGFGGYGYGGYGYGGSYYGGSQYGTSSSAGEEGSLRLKIKPREASVFVDGYYVGLVDDFDGIFQKLNIEAGPHRVEIRAPGYETLSFEVRLVPDHTTTYTGELKKIQ